jgi:high-affinity nickel-transport protein
MLLVLSSIDSFIKGLIYIFIFGLGSIIGMSIMSVIIGMPSIMLSKITNSYEKYLQIIAGIASIMIGSFLTYKIGFVEGLFF